MDSSVSILTQYLQQFWQDWTYKIRESESWWNRCCYNDKDFNTNVIHIVYKCIYIWSNLGKPHGSHVMVE